MQTYIATSGWFNTAGYKFNWVRDGYLAEGIGLSKAASGDGENMYVIVNNKKYILNVSQANKFIKRYQSIYTVGKGVRVGVVSKSLLTLVE